MKRKSHHSIPDFSRKPSRPGGSRAVPQPGKTAGPAPAHTNVKPRATSAKSGRRGQ